MSRTPLVLATAVAFRGSRFAARVLVTCLAAAGASAMTVRGTVHTEKAGTTLSVRVWALGDALAAKPALLDAPLATAQATGGAPFAIDVGDAVPPLLVEALAERHVGAEYLVTLPEEASLPAVWLPVGEELRVRVTRRGKPEPDVRVGGSVSRQGVQERGWGAWSATLPSHRTDARGEVRWWVPVGSGVSCSALARDGRWGRESRYPPFAGAVEVKLDSRALPVKVVDAREESVVGIELAARSAPLGSVAVTTADGTAVVQVAGEADSDVVAWGATLAGRMLVRKDATGPLVVKAEPRRWLELTWTGPPRVMAYPTWVPLAVSRLRLVWTSGGRVKVPWLEPGGQVQLWAPGFSQVDQQVASADQPVAAVLQAGVRVDGVVQDGEQKPLSGIPVWAYLPRFRGAVGMRTQSDFLVRATLAWGVSDGRGRFVLPPLPPGFLRLRAMRPGFPAAQHGPVETSAGGQASVTLTFEAGTTLRVQVVDAQAAPLAGVAVKAYAREKDERPWLRKPGVGELERQEAAASGLGDAEGRATLTALPAGKAWVLLRLPGYVPRVLEVELPREGLDLGTQALEAAVDVVGKVVDEAGKGLPDADVWAATGGGFGAAGVARSDAEGRFVLADQPRQGEVVVEAGLKGYVLTAPVKVALPPAAEVTVRMRVGKVIAGRVVDADTQQPVKDAWVLASQVNLAGGMRSSSTRANARTDEQGQFSLEGLEPMELSVTVRAQGYRVETQPVKVPLEGEPPPVTVALHKGLELRGRVLDPTGQPAPAVQVTAGEAETNQMSSAVPSFGGARTGPDGSFVIEGLGPGKHDVRAQAEDGASARTVAEPGGAEVVLRLERAGAVQGRVRAGEGVSVAGIRLQLFGNRSFGGDTRTDENGSFSFEKVPPGSHTLFAEGYTIVGGRQEVKIEPGRTTAVEVVLERTGTIVGTIRGLGAAALESCEVYAGRGMLRPGADGTFRAEGVRVGEVTVRASVGLDGRTRTAQVEVVAGETANVDIDFAQGVRVDGTVRRSSGEVAGLRVSAAGGASRGDALTDESGSFVVEGVVPGRIEVEVRERSGRLLVMRSLDVDRDVTLDLRVSDGELRGRVLAAKDRAPVAGATVQVRASGAGSESSRAVVTDATGAFTCSELDAGTYVVQAGARGYAPADTTVSLSEGSVEVELVLEPEQGVELVVRRADGRPAEEVWLQLFRGELAYSQVDLVCDAQGRATLRGVAAGAYEAAVIGRQVWRGTIQVPGPPVTILLHEAGELAVVVQTGGGPWRVRAVEVASGRSLPVFGGRGFEVRLGWATVAEGQVSVEGALGAVTVEAVAPDGRTYSKTVEVAPRSTTSVRFP